MYCYVYTLQTVEGNEPSLSHLWLCDYYDERFVVHYNFNVNTLKAVGTVLCIAMCTRYRQLEGMSHLSLTCGCAHRLL